MIKANIFTLVIRLQKTFSRRLQDVLVKTDIFVIAICLEDALQRRLKGVLQKRLEDNFKTSLRRFKNVFKTSSRHLQEALPRRLQDVLQKRPQDIFKTSRKDNFKTLSRRIIKLTRLRDVFTTYVRRTAKAVIYRGICLGHTTSEKFRVGVQNFRERKIYQVLVFHFITPFSGCLRRRI